MSRVLVTGGAGFIGSNLAKALLKRGEEVTVLDNLSTGFRENIPVECEFIQADVSLQSTWHDLPEFDVVFHLAAMVSVVESQENPIQCEKDNVHSIIYLNEYARRVALKKVVFASSAAIYGDLAALQVESQYPSPKSPYGLSKLSGEYLLSMNYEEHSIPYVALRMFNVFGPYQSVKSAYASVVPIFLTRALNSQSLAIYGDGEQTRDFIYVDQVVNYYIQAMDKGSDLVGVYNAGNNRSLSIKELANRILVLTDSKSEVIFKEVRPGDIRESLASVERLKSEFNFQDFDFESCLRKTLEYYRSL